MQSVIDDEKKDLKHAPRIRFNSAEKTYWIECDKCLAVTAESIHPGAAINDWKAGRIIPGSDRCAAAS